MSYTEIYKFKKDGNAECLAEVKNAWRGAMAIWNILDKKYLPTFIPEWTKYFPEESNKTYYRTSDLSGKEIKKIWELYENKDVSFVDQICLATTFDRVVVFKENLPTIIQSFREFEGETSLKEQADIIEKALNEDEDLVAIAWNQTSVNCDVWVNPDETDADGNYKPYNIFRLKNHWNLFE